MAESPSIWVDWVMKMAPANKSACHRKEIVHFYCYKWKQPNQTSPLVPKFLWICRGEWPELRGTLWSSDLQTVYGYTLALCRHLRPCTRGEKASQASWDKKGPEIGSWSLIYTYWVLCWRMLAHYMWWAEEYLAKNTCFVNQNSM